jgi:hypothetical protein
VSDRLSDVGLVVLAVVTIALVGILLERQRDLTVATDPAGRPAAVAPQADPAAPAEQTSDDASEEASPQAGAARVADARGTVVLHAESAPCRDASAPAAVTVQRDGAEEQELEVEGLRTVTGLQVVDADRLRIIGGGLNCRPVAMSTSDGGATWQRDDAFGFWSLVPGDQRRLVRSSGTATAPCGSVTVSGIDLGVARVLCQDGRVFGTADGGKAWVMLGQAPSPLGVSYATPALGFALVEDAGCDGVAIHRTTNGGASWKPLHCVKLAGPWAISTNDDVVGVVGDGGAVELSDDAGDSWRAQTGT